jgi:hypothetical protein
MEMKILTHPAIEKCKQFIQTQCSPLTQALYAHHLEHPNPSLVWRLLATELGRWFSQLRRF